MSDPVQKQSALGMSDEDFAKADPLSFGMSEEKEESVEEVTPEPEVTQEENKEAEVDEVAKGEQPEADESADAEKVSENKEEPTEAETPKEEKPAENAVDYKAAYEKLFTPFKANGRDIAVSNVEDAIALMQMGANYNKKMAALKPNLKLMKLLENNGLLNEERIGFLIDLEKKNPEAINKLVKDSGLDPMDLNAEKVGEYQPKTYTVDDREMELDAVLDEIQGTPSYGRTLDIVSSKWDAASKQVVAGTPQLIKVINSHVQSGVYDAIIKEVESERMFGRLSGLSDIDAYRQVGDALKARGGFNHLGHQGNQTPTKPVVVQPKPKAIENDKLRDKRLAASTSKPAGSSSVVKEYNPLSMSDEEFSKLVNQKFL